MRRHLIDILALGLVVLTGGLLVLVLWTLGLGYLLMGSLLYFPGDPPFPDIVLPYAIGCVGLALGLVLLTRRSAQVPGPGRRLVRTTSRALLAASTFAAFICLGCIAYRFSPAWRDVRSLIRSHSAAILAAAGGDPHRVLTREEFLTIEQSRFAVPVEATLRGYGVVRLRMAHRTYPFVGVAFGGGANASFDPATMYCTYSD